MDIKNILFQEERIHGVCTIKKVSMEFIPVAEYASNGYCNTVGTYTVEIMHSGNT